MEQYTVAIIGGGPAGYVAAIRSAQLGARVVVFEKDTLGGTCLNRGCIPMKTLLKTADTLKEIRSCASRGIVLEGAATVDMAAVIANKAKVVKTLTGGVGSLLRANKVTVITGTAVLTGEHTIRCGQTEVEAEKIILCPGSVPSPLPIPGADLPGVLDSTRLLELQQCPGSLCIIGGGVIGCEVAEAYAAFGARVTIVEMMDSLVSMFDADVCAEVTKSLKHQGVTVLTGTRSREIKAGPEGLQVVTSNGTVDCENVLVCVGRKPDLTCLGALEGRIAVEKGHVRVDDRMSTSVSHIYACGDVNARMMLTHAAYYMGEVAAENAMGKVRRADFRAVPTCMYTTPEIAMVGLTEAQAREKYGDTIRVGTYKMGGNGRAIAGDLRDGLVKVICDDKYGRILGVHLCGGIATEQINEAQLAMEAEVTVDELVERIVHPHPSYSEGFAEACQAVLRRSIHQPPSRR